MAANVRQSEVLSDSKDYSQKPGRLTIHLDEMWSFVGSKDNKQWAWLAIDADNREIVGVFVGNRSRQSAKELWQSLLMVYRQFKCGREHPATLPCQCAVCYPDFWQVYEHVLPSKRRRIVGKETGNQLY